MVLHTQTIFIALVLVVGVSVLLHTLNWRLHSDMHGPAVWALGTSMLFLGLLLIALRGALQEPITIVATNLLLISGSLTMRHGLRMFAGLAPDFRLPALALPAMLAGAMYFTLVEPSLVKRWIAGTVVAVPILLSMLQALRVIATIDRGIGALTLGAVLGGNIIFLIATATAMTILEGDAAGPFAPSRVLPFAFLFVLMLEVIRTYSYLLLTANRSRRQLQELALQDALTLLPNRRALETAFQRASAVATRRKDRDIGLVVFDLDHFKHVNDAHGHQVGDAVLCHFARLAANCIRPDDTLARLGGEEFALLVIDPGSNGAFEAAERIRTTLVAMPFALETQSLAITVSAGVVVARSDSADFQAMYRAADAALYRAKLDGRNRVAIATP